MVKHFIYPAKEADEQAQNGLDVVKQSYHSIESLANEIDGLAQRINNLHESSQNLTNVVDVIKSVADQTNLLALNAAIEGQERVSKDVALLWLPMKSECLHGVLKRLPLKLKALLPHYNMMLTLHLM